MNSLTRLLILMPLVLGLWGCATAEPVKVAPAPVERATYFYAGAMELPLKSAPEPGSSTTATVSLNERLQQMERRGSWFLVRAENGSQGWANDRDLNLSPQKELYVRRWGASLRSEPQGSSKSLGRLRANDQATLQDKNSQGWAKITVARTGKTGWIELKDLSLSKVRVRRLTRPKSGAATEETAAEPAASTPPAPSSVLAPKAASAAPPPAKPAPSAGPRQAKPGMFEPF